MTAEVLAGFASVLTAVSLLVGAWAAKTARNVGKRTQTRQETQQALDAQNTLLDRYEKRIDAQDRKIAELERLAENAIADRNNLIQAHKQCERELELVKLQLGRQS